MTVIVRIEYTCCHGIVAISRLREMYINDRGYQYSFRVFPLVGCVKRAILEFVQEKASELNRLFMKFGWGSSQIRKLHC